MNTPGPLLDQAFQALSNPTRRAVIERLGKGPATVKELADPFDMALPSFLQHLEVLERGGLITSRKTGRVRTVRIRADQLIRVTGWLDEQRELWERRLDQLDEHLKNMEEK